MNERAIILLNACRNLLDKQNNSNYVLDLLSEIVNYDDTDCDGSCLLDDLNDFLKEVDNNDCKSL